MAAPFNHEDLAKLKSFVDFVAANPVVLNLPELHFLKKLIIQMGGKVPEGTYQMPAGAKCPFGGDVKSETKPTPPPADADEEEMPEMEAESEESEVELDMEANHVNVLEPNILYLDEKPPKIVKTKTKKSHKKPSGKIKSKHKSSSTSRKRSSKQSHHNVKKELCLKQEQDDKMDNYDPDDPLYMAKVEVKSELGDENQNADIYNCEAEKQEDFDNDDDQDRDYNYDHDRLRRKSKRIDEDEYDDDDDEEEDDDDDEYDDNEEDEDEPLIVLAQRKGRPRTKVHHVDDEKVKAPRRVDCLEICKKKCTETFSEEQRKNICDYYWNLNKDDRLSFIRKHIRARRLTRFIRVKVNRVRGNNCCYYLKTYKIGCEETTPENSNDLIRVCRKFFEATLCITSHVVKKANDGTVMEIEQDLELLNQIKEAKEKEKCQEPKQILDPETGNLITLEPGKGNKIPKPKPQISPDETNETKKQKRRRGDPEPERFPKPINCAIRCIHKCHIKFTEEERKQICDFFWSLDYKRRKDFILANMEIKDIESQTTSEFRKTNRPPRSYQTRYFMRSGGMRGENLRVCKDFFAKTLCINRYFFKNAIQFADKTTGYYTGSDGRGIHMAHNKIPNERRQMVLDHIDSYPLWIPNKKSKTKYLHHSLTIKKMHEEYKQKCDAAKIESVSLHYYYRAFHAHAHLLFLASPSPKKGGGFLKANPNISHYTGEEPGGCWIDIKGNKLDLRVFNPARSLDTYQASASTDVSQDNSSMVPNPFASGSNASVAVHNALNVLNPSTFMPLKTTTNQPPSLAAVVRPDLNSALYGNLAQDSINMFRMF